MKKPTEQWAFWWTLKINLALWRVLVYDKCGSAAPRRRQAHAVKRARRAENESEAESPAEPLGRPSAFSLSRDFPSSRLLRFHSGDCVCLAKAVLLDNSALSVISLHMPHRGDANRIMPCRLVPRNVGCSCHNTSARCLSWAHCRIVLSKVNGRKSLPKCSNLWTVMQGFSFPVDF